MKPATPQLIPQAVIVDRGSKSDEPNVTGLSNPIQPMNVAQGAVTRGGGGAVALIIIIVMFTVSNTMNMAVLERTVEIGTLRAMGVRRSGIQRIFVVEGVLLGLTGALMGLVIAQGVAHALETLGLTWLPPAYVTPVPLSIHLVGEWRLIGTTLVGLVAAGVMQAGDMTLKQRNELLADMIDCIIKVVFFFFFI